jgi:site-specific DNA recombinase
MVGPLAYLLKNRFYIGEVVYRGEVYPGEQQPIVEKELFEAVQAKLKHRAVARQVRQSRSPSFLSGLLFDDRGNPMSPSHTNKKGVRYRYYVSQAVLQNRKDEVGSIARVAAPDIEKLVIAALRHQVGDTKRQLVPNQTSPLLELSDRDLVALHVERIVLRSRWIDITLPSRASPEGQDAADPSSPASTPLHLPWTPTSVSARKGIAWKPSAQSNLDPATSDLLLTAIARARSWMNDLVEGRVNSFEEIARSENKVVRHIQHLAPLAFVSPRIVEAIADGSAPAELTVTMLARALPHGWAAQEHKLSVS